ncbi:hypothetical protein [Chishuiella sp.]|uniref:hypothetical protein n=1 Tax=Chishuiella sp. TaxID=1969467 RepID=UPI0028A9AFFC|nr:hypothetical protein [Chishuiella sp.]
MKKNCLLLLLFIVSICNAQDKSYRFVYDLNQEMIMTEEMKNLNPKNLIPDIQNAFNESYVYDVVTSENASLLKIREKVYNSQNKGIHIEPEPKWLLIDYANNETTNFTRLGDSYIMDSIKTLQLKPTKNNKIILGMPAREFTAEYEDNFYSIWLSRFNSLTVSPIIFQFKNYIVSEITIVNKKVEEEGGKMIKRYVLSDLSEDKTKIDYKKMKPKNVLTTKEYNDFMEKLENSGNNSVDRE